MQARISFQIEVLTSSIGKRNRIAQFDVCCEAIDQNFDWGCILTLHPQKGLSKFAPISKSKQYIYIQKIWNYWLKRAALEQLRILPQDMKLNTTYHFNIKTG